MMNISSENWSGDRWQKSKTINVPWSSLLVIGAQWHVQMIMMGGNKSNTLTLRCQGQWLPCLDQKLHTVLQAWGGVSSSLKFLWTLYFGQILCSRHLFHLKWTSYTVSLFGMILPNLEDPIYDQFSRSWTFLPLMFMALMLKMWSMCYSISITRGLVINGTEFWSPPQTYLSESAVYTLIFIALFTIVKTWKPPKFPSAEEWIKIRKSFWVTKYFFSHSLHHLFIYGTFHSLAHTVSTPHGYRKNSSHLMGSNTD